MLKMCRIPHPVKCTKMCQIPRPPSLEPPAWPGHFNHCVQGKTFTEDFMIFCIKKWYFCSRACQLPQHSVARPRVQRQTSMAVRQLKDPTIESGHSTEYITDADHKIVFDKTVLRGCVVTRRDDTTATRRCRTAVSSRRYALCDPWP